MPEDAASPAGAIHAHETRSLHLWPAHSHRAVTRRRRLATAPDGEVSHRLRPGTEPSLPDPFT